jgi:hypothetical protein
MRLTSDTKQRCQPFLNLSPKKLTYLHRGKPDHPPYLTGSSAKKQKTGDTIRDIDPYSQKTAAFVVDFMSSDGGRIVPSREIKIVNGRKYNPKHWIF